MAAVIVEAARTPSCKNEEIKSQIEHAMHLIQNDRFIIKTYSYHSV